MLDFIIKSGMIVDGSGTPPFQADLAVKDGKIIEISRSVEADSQDIYNAKGKMVVPGFIDMHRHADRKVFEDGYGEVELRQGITTAVSGNCGLSLSPCPTEHVKELYPFLSSIMGEIPETLRFDTFGQYIKAVEAQKLSMNYGSFVGNGTVRCAVKGFERGPMTKSQRDRAKGYIRDACEEGALGLSLGIMYAPENYNTLEEQIALASVIAPFNGLLTTHMRAEGSALLSAMDEVITIAKQAGVRLNISHFKAADRNSWGELFDRALQKVDTAKSEGFDISFDVYPYEAGSTLLVTVLPPAYLEGGLAKAIDRFKSRKIRKDIQRELACLHADWDNLLYSLGWKSVVVGSVGQEKNRMLVGSNIEDIARMQGKDPLDCALDLLVEEEGKVTIIYFTMSLADVKKALLYPGSMLISDSVYPPRGLPHPRLYGAFPRFLAEYVRRQKAITVEKAINKMTCLPAKRLGLTQKGLLKPGYDADITVFDPEQVQDHASYANPVSLASGFEFVFVAGKMAVREDRFLQPASGRIVKGRGGRDKAEE